MTEDLSTGIEPLDHALGGGVPAGTVVALSADPRSRSERVLYELASERRTLYLTATRSEEMVRDALSRHGVDLDRCVVREVDAECPLDHAYKLVQQLSRQATVVVDPANALERAGDGRLAEFLNTLRGRLADTDSVGVLHCLEGRGVPPERDVTEHVADGIVAVANERRDDRLETRLTVPKFRGRPPVTEPVALAFERARADRGTVA